MLVYTEQVIQEGMRLFPPAWMLARSPVADDELAGYHIPARSLVFVSPWIIHRNPEVWEDPEGFDPDRFAPGADAGRDRFAFFPFGGGPRICIGQGFAMQEAKLMLATIVQRYRLDLVPGFRVVPETAVTLRPKYGIFMRAIRRS
jgi:cytochrome P450